MVTHAMKNSIHRQPRVRRLLRSALVATASIAALVSGAFTGAQTGYAAQPDEPPFRLALSPSPFTTFMLDDLPFILTDGERTADDALSLIRLYAAHGATEVYARATTRLERNTVGGSIADHGFRNATRLGQLARQEGLDFNIELGVFRTYGDLLCQTPPDFADFPEVRVPGPLARAHD